MDDERFRRRLEAINRGEQFAEPNNGGVDAPCASTTCTTSMPTARAVVRPRVVKPIPALLQRGELVATYYGKHWRVRLPIDELWPGGSRLVAARQQHLQQLLDADGGRQDSAEVMHADFAVFAAALPDRVLLLDLETCGLAGAALFLVGLLRHVDGTPTVELLVARDYAEEQAVLESLWKTIAAHDVLVTFNGKSFDWPMVMDRTTRFRLDQDTIGRKVVHVDVLHHARRRWRGMLPDFRLQTLEELVCRRRREGDLPGRLIPAAYAEFVRTGHQREMDAILYHNAVDLVTLLDLALRLAA